MSVTTTTANGQPVWGTSGASITGSVAAGSYSFTVANSDNSSTSSSAYFEAKVGGTSAGHPHYRATITGGTSWLWGARNDDSDSFYLCTGTDITSNKKMIITTAAAAYFASTATQWGLSASTGLAVVHSLGNTAGSHCFTAGTGATGGGNLICYEATHANANQVALRAGSTVGATVLNGGKLVANVGLGLGNSASATVAVGTLANKFQVFDASGNSLGYVPIYATIT